MSAHLARLVLREVHAAGISARMPKERTMQDNDTNLLLRDDTMLGVCQGLGEDFGFNPLWLRIAFGATLLINPIAVVGTYLGLGVLVATSRVIFPRPRRAEPTSTTAAEPVPANEAELLPVAA
jgi:phage shock protein PspC (stress-responsive transcriptional regulator)